MKTTLYIFGLAIALLLFSGCGKNEDELLPLDSTLNSSVKTHHTSEKSVLPPSPVNSN